MVKLTLDFIIRRTSGYAKKQREESLRHYLRRLTHLYLEGKHIDEIGDDLTNCPHLTVLYLYDNQLTRVPNLSRNSLLTHLYLQNNLITRLENLTSLQKLTKLFVGGNSIAVVEGLENLMNLHELHIENQKLGPGEKLLFDPRSIRLIANSLTVLNVSGNRLTSLADLECLTQLTQLYAADNQLSDIKETAQLTASSWRYLAKIDLSNNPLCQCARYRDQIIVVAPHLEVFDGKEVTEMSKQFLKNWRANKQAVQQKLLTRQSAPNLHTQDGEGDAQYFQQSRRLAYIVPALPHAQFSKILARSNSSNSQVPNTVSSGSLPVNNPRRITSKTTDSIRYLNSYGTYYQDTRPKPSYHISLLNINPDQRNI